MYSANALNVLSNLYALEDYDTTSDSTQDVISSSALLPFRDKVAKYGLWVCF